MAAWMLHPYKPPVLIGLLSAGLLTSIGLTPLFPAARAEAQSGITSPAPGVLCDQLGPTCYDRQGPSIGLTQTYFGISAANRLSAELRNRPQTNDFRLSNGAVCDLRAATCWSDGWQRSTLAPQLTQQLFGAPQGSNTATGNGLQGLQTPKSGVVCDPGGQLCYDQAGISLGLTREYFGTYAEQTALRNLAGQAPPRQFRLSNDSTCDLNARTCWSDNWNRQQVNVALSNQLFGGGNSGSGTGNGTGSGTGSGSQVRAAQCRMTRWFKTLYNGNCELRETSRKQGRLLEVNLQDGNLYSISRPRGGSYQISDRNGATWPVQVNDQGRTISFNWSDRALTVTPQVAPSNGGSLLQLINTLLGY
jgi:hypothetical protein